MSLLEAHLAEYHLDDLLDVLAEAGIESIDDAMALEPDDLEALGCTAVQAIALRASFGHGGEGAQQMAASMAGALEAARTMSIRGGGAHHPLPTPGASTAAASSGGASWGYTADDLGGSELGVHLEAWGLISWAAPLLADSGIELIADVQTLTWSDLEHMGFGLEQAKQLRHSIGMDEAPPAEWAHRVESAAAAEQHEQREARARAFSRQQDLKKRSSIITESPAARVAHRVPTAQPRPGAPPGPGVVSHAAMTQPFTPLAVAQVHRHEARGRRQQQGARAKAARRLATVGRRAHAGNDHLGSERRRRPCGGERPGPWAGRRAGSRPAQHHDAGGLRARARRVGRARGAP